MRSHKSPTGVFFGLLLQAPILSSFHLLEEHPQGKSGEAQPAFYALSTKGFQDDPCTVLALGENLEKLGERKTPTGLEIALSSDGSQVAAAYFDLDAQEHFIQILDPLLRPLCAPTPLPKIEGIHMLGTGSLFFAETSLWVFCWEIRPMGEPPFNQPVQVFHRFALPKAANAEKILSAQEVPEKLRLVPEGGMVLGAASGSFLVLSQGRLHRIRLDGASSAAASLDLLGKGEEYSLQFMDAAPSWRLSEEELILVTNQGRVLEVALPDLRLKRDRKLPGFPKGWPGGGGDTWLRSIQVRKVGEKGKIFVGESPQGYAELVLRILRFDLETMTQEGAWEFKRTSTFAVGEKGWLIAGGEYPCTIFLYGEGEPRSCSGPGYLYRLISVR